jgi:IPP transferase
MGRSCRQTLCKCIGAWTLAQISCPCQNGEVRLPPLHTALAHRFEKLRHFALQEALLAFEASLNDPPVLAGVPHHLIDILNPDEGFSAGDFHDRAHAAVRDILSRSKLPIVVGGTGFYLRMFLFGKPGGGTATEAEHGEALRLIEDSKTQRATEEGLQVAELTEDQSWEAGVAVLTDLGDPESAERCVCCVQLWLPACRTR